MPIYLYRNSKLCQALEMEIDEYHIDNVNIKKYNLEYGFRNAGSYLIPFLKIKFPKEMIKVLVANPTIATDSLAIKSLAAFIDYYEYTETAIGVSTVPLRY